MREAAKIKAFGEELSAPEWVEHPRCVVGLQTLRARLRWGWDAERAISEPSIRALAKTQPPPWTAEGRRPQLLEQLVSRRLEASLSATEVDRLAHACRGWVRSLEVGRWPTSLRHAITLANAHGADVLLVDTNDGTVLARSGTGSSARAPIVAALRARRQASDWTRTDLARELAMRTDTLDHKERGRHDVLLTELEAWAALLGTELALGQVAEDAAPPSES